MASVDCQPQWLPGNGNLQLVGAVAASCRWDPDGAGPEPVCLVVAATFRTTDAVSTYGLATWDGSSWRAVPGGPTEGTALAISHDGHLIAAGRFGAEDGTRKVAQYDGSTWTFLGSSFRHATPPSLASINSLAVLESGHIAAGGNFYFIGDAAAHSIAVWNGAEWESLQGGLNGTVRAVVGVPGGLVATGIFITTAAGASVGHIAKWNGTTWSSLGSGLQSARGGNSLLLRKSGDLIVGGSFTGAGGQPAANIARWDGTQWFPLGSGIAGTAVPRAFVLVENDIGDLIVGGVFTSAGGSAASAIAKWNGSQWAPVAPGGSDGSIVTITQIDESQYFVGGQFSSMGGEPLKHIARWDGAAWRALDALAAGLDNVVYALQMLPTGELIAGGVFMNAGGEKARSLAIWNGNKWSAQFPLSVGGSVSAMARAGADVLVAGSFGYVGNLNASCIAKWDGASWQALGSGFGLANPTDFLPPVVSAIAVAPNGDVFAGGQFNLAGGAGANNIARWNGTGWQPLGGGLGGLGPPEQYFVGAIAVLPGGDVVAGGRFDDADGLAVKNVARWNGSAWSALGAGVTGLAFPAVWSLLVSPEGELIVGGRFQQAGGIVANSIAKWDGVAWSAMGSGFTGPAGSDPRVHALVRRPAGDIVAGGYFAKSGDVEVNGIARWNGQTWLPLESGVSVASGNAYVRALLNHPSGELIVGGNFTEAGSQSANCWARWTDSNSVWIAQQPRAATIMAGETLELASTPASGFSGVSFVWSRDSQGIVNGPGGASIGGGIVMGAVGDFQGFTHGAASELRISNVATSDAGEYAVLFSSACGESRSIPISIKVKAHIADINADGRVDDADFLLFLNQYDLMLCADASMPDSCSADFNHDGAVDDADFGIFVPAYNAMLVN